MTENEQTKDQLIAALRQRVAELEATEQQYFSLFEHAGDSIYIADPVTFAIIDANSPAARRLGYTRDELLRLNLDDLEVLPQEDETHMLSAWESSFSGSRTYECHYRRKNGSLIPVEVSSRVVTVGDHQIVQNAVRDITKRKAAEIALREAVEELDAFAHTVAHDLKSPLSVMLSYTWMLLDEVEQMPTELIRTFSEALARNGAKMNSIINELLLLASVRKLDEVEIVPLDMGFVIREALGRLKLMIEEYQAEIVMPELWPAASGYASWVEEVWANYISNAIKYGGTPPVVEVGATLLDDHSVCCWVKDNGVGLDADQQARLFNQFTRLDETRAQGHGLGLSIVQRIVDKLGGRVGVESAKGAGSVFSFTLPASEGRSH
ncbi:MAG: PAS domain S-box protein [Anaerolineales bacterium]|nr:PAS domain S-box protein [Anaerolineales bacterium]MCB8983640.1 PAS domain-containing sensor histidine kinase [Ardenticatenaceae bacterium]